jgi:hypothetical protein
VDPFLLEFDVHLHGSVRLRTVPTPVSVLGLDIIDSQKGLTMAVHKCTPQLSPVNPADQVTSRPVTVSFDDGTPSINLDMIDPAASFDANDGQTGNVAALGDINAIGQGQVSGAPFQFTVSGGAPTAVPGPVSVTGVTVA